MIRAMQLADLDEIMEIEKDIFTSPWAKENYAYELSENPHANYYVYLIEDEIVAYCGCWCLFEQAQITTIGVHPTHRNKGIAKKLMDKIITETVRLGCETLSLEVRVSNNKAINLYKQYQFEIINIRKSYYKDNNEDAYLMMRAIGG